MTLDVGCTLVLRGQQVQGIDDGLAGIRGSDDAVELTEDTDTSGLTVSSS